jgi:flavin-dependent dehydrogenase
VNQIQAAAFDGRPVETLTADVFIAGGGAAGLAAAVTAARQGCRVVLAERYGFCGGGAVAGLSGTVCGLYEATENGNGPTQVVHGFVDEFIREMRERNGLGDPVKYGKTWTLVHDPLVWREVGDAFLREAGVTVIYHATVTEVLMEGDAVRGAQLYTKQGKVRVLAPVTIDASGDADLVSMAGWQTTMGDNGHVQNPTMIFRLGALSGHLRGGHDHAARSLRKDCRGEQKRLPAAARQDLVVSHHPPR